VFIGLAWDGTRFDRLLRRKFRGGFSSAVTGRISSIGSSRAVPAGCRLECHSIQTQRPRNAPVMMITAIVAASIPLPLPPFDSVTYRCEFPLETPLPRMTSRGLRMSNRTNVSGAAFVQSGVAPLGCGRRHPEDRQFLRHPRSGRPLTRAFLLTARVRSTGAA